MTQAAERFAIPASDDVLLEVETNLRKRNLNPVVVDDAAAACRAVIDLIPAGAEVHSGKSKTLEDAGIFSEVRDSGRYDFLRNRLMKMDRQTQSVEMRKLGSAPDYMLGSANAVTSDGVVVIASASASQLGPLASGAGKVILVVGSQKLVPDLDTAFRRIRDYVLPWEDARVQEAMGVHTLLAKMLLIEAEWQPDRTTVVLVREPIGI